MRIPRPLCIYHGNCKDGFTAAWVVRQQYPDAEFFPGVYQQAPPSVIDRDVILVDFSYKRPVMLNMGRVAASVLVLDHHASALQEMENLPNVATVFDMERSGAGIAWDYYFPNHQRPSFIDYVEDRDLWRKSLPDNDAFSLALSSYPQEFAIWDSLVPSVRRLIEEGKPIQRYYQRVTDTLRAESHPATLAGIPCRVVNAPYAFASEVANDIIFDGAKFGACYFQRADRQWQYSLRSEGDFSVAAVAQQFGGGGHQHAAGFSSAKLEHLSVQPLGVS